MQKSIKNIFTLGSVLLLTACSAAKMNITSKPVGVQQTAGYVSTGITETQPLEVRTYQKVEDSLKEVQKVNCELKGRGFTAKVITPGIVNIPVYGKGSPAVTTYCTSNDLAGTKSALIANLDLQTRKASTANAGATGGLLGALIATAVSANMGERKGDRFAYNPIAVTISPK